MKLIKSLLSNRPLYHFSGESIVFDKKHKYSQTFYPFKPVGLWLSDEDNGGWKEWCQSEHFNLDNLKYCYEVVLKYKHILMLQDDHDLKMFNYAYKTLQHGIHMIDWKSVTKDYNGIIITPYSQDHRLDLKFMWYYGWDCASGCIWNLDEIESFKLLKSEALCKVT